MIIIQYMDVQCMVYKSTLDITRSISEVDEAKDFLVFQYYDDTKCARLVGAAAQVIGE